MAARDRSRTGAATPATAIELRWRGAAVALAVAGLLLVGLFWEASAAMVNVWYSSTTFNHGFLILPIVGYLVWLRRDQLRAVTPRPAAFGLCLLALGAAIWLVADAADIILIQQFALVGMIQATVLAFLGWRATLTLSFPLAYLFFAVPFGEFLVPRLQLITAFISVEALRLTNVPVFIDGLFIQIPTGRFLVAEACSGVRFLIASIALGALFANIMYRALWRRLLFMVLSVIVPIIANGIRAFGIIMLAHLTDNELAVGVDHLVYGWIFFSFVLLLLFALGMTFRERNPDDRIVAARPAAILSETAWRRRFSATAVAFLAIVLAAPGYATLRETSVASTAESRISPPIIGGGWRKVDGSRDSWRPKFVGADTTLRQTYARNGRRVHLFVAYYAWQRQGAELVSQVNRLAGDDFWEWNGGGQTVAPIGGQRVTTRMALISSRHGRRVVWQWYWLDGSYTASPLIAKWRQARIRLLGGPPEGAAIAIAAEFEDRPAEAARVLRDFARNLGPLSATLEAAGGE